MSIERHRGPFTLCRWEPRGYIDLGTVRTAAEARDAVSRLLSREVPRISIWSDGERRWISAFTNGGEECYLVPLTAVWATKFVTKSSGTAGSRGKGKGQKANSSRRTTRDRQIAARL